MAEQTAISHDLSQLVDNIKDIRIAMMTTVEADGSLHTRPMYTHEPEADGTLWFFTQYDSSKISEVQHDRHLSLGYAKPEDNLYVAISGTATVVTDRAKIKELWSEALRGWFPNGQDDPNIALLKVSIHTGEYWNSPNSVLLRAYAYAKAVVTGKPHQPGPEEHAIVLP